LIERVRKSISGKIITLAIMILAGFTFINVLAQYAPMQQPPPQQQNPGSPPKSDTTIFPGTNIVPGMLPKTNTVPVLRTNKAPPVLDISMPKTIRAPGGGKFFWEYYIRPSNADFITFNGKLSSPYQFMTLSSLTNTTWIMSTNRIEHRNTIGYNPLILDKTTWDAMFARTVLEELARKKQQDEKVAGLFVIHLPGKDPDESPQLLIYGQQSLGISYGQSFFLNKNSDQARRAASSAVKNDLDLDQSIDINIKGKIGKKVDINVNNSGKTLNQIDVEYHTPKQEAFIQKISAGNISVSLPGSSLAAGSSGGGGEALGVKIDARKDKFNFQLIASMARGIPAMKSWKGSSQPIILDKLDYDYVRFKYFVLPQAYKPGTLKIYLDDKLATYYEQSIDSNHCYRLTAGVDFIERGNGLIYFQRTLDRSFDILVSYVPIASSNIAPGPSATFGKYTNVVKNFNGGVTNRYIYLWSSLAAKPSPYEFRGVYNLGYTHINTAKNFIIYVADNTAAKLDDSKGYKLNRDYDTTFIPYPIPGTGIYNNYYLDEDNGLLIFRDSEPFRNLYNGIGRSADDYVYTYTVNQSLYPSQSHVHLEFLYEVRSYNLGWDLIENSEIVTVDGAVWKKGIDYDINYLTGEVKFIRPINPDSEIDISYQYSPFGGASQQILLGLRTDFKPWDWLTLSSVAFYNGRQRPITVPTPSSSAEEHVVGSLFGNFSLSGEKIGEVLTNLGIKPKTNSKSTNKQPRPPFVVPIDLTFGGEVAGSLYNPNNFGQAMLEDFQGTRNTRNIYMDFHKFLLYSPINNAEWGSSTLDPAKRGKIYYKDYFIYAQYSLNSRFYYEKLDYNFAADPDTGIADASSRTNVSYFTKPGPYMVGEGHIDDSKINTFQNQRQQCMVLDYDFTAATNNGWISLVNNYVFDKTGADFSEYKELDIWCKLISDNPTNKVELVTEIGKFNEDIDNTGEFKEEKTSYDNGFVFKDPLGAGDTKVGGGSGLIINGKVSSNDGVRQTEDFDGNLRLDRITSQGDTGLIIPDGIFSRVVAGNAPGMLAKSCVMIADNQWKLVRISIDPSQMNPAQLDIYKRGIKNMFLILKQKSGFRGKLLIDTMSFVGPAYNDMRVNSSVNQTNNFYHIDVNYISTYESLSSTSFYANSLRNFTESDKFSKDAKFKNIPSFDQLHGRKTQSEWDQTEWFGFQLSYFDMKTHNFTLPIASQTNSFILAGRDLTAPIDLRFYKTIRMWLRPVKKQSDVGDEWFVYRFGSSSGDFYEYRQQISSMDYQSWNLVSIDLRSRDFTSTTNHLYLNPTDPNSHYRIEGKPSLRNVRYIGYGIYSGAITTNKNSGIIWLNDNYVDNVDVQSGLAYYWNGGLTLRKHLSLAYSYSKMDKYFSSIGAAGTGTASESSSFSAGWSSLALLPVNFGWSRSKTSTDLDDISIPYDQKGQNNSDTKNINTTLGLSSLPFWGKFKANIPDFSAGYRIDISSNQRPRSLAQMNYLFYKSSSESWNLSTSWTPPFLNLLKINLTTSFSYSYSRSSQLSFTYPVSNSMTNRWADNPISSSMAFSGQGNLGFAGFSVAPAFTYSQAFSEQKKFWTRNDDPTELQIHDATTHDPQLNSRNRTFSTPINFPKIWIIQLPPLSYNISYAESGFQYSSSLTNGLVWRNPTTTISLSESFPSFKFKNFFIEEITPSYRRSFSYNDSKVQDDRHGGLDHFWTVMSNFGEVLIPWPLQFMDFYLPITNSPLTPANPRYHAFDFLSRMTNRPDSSVTVSDSLDLSIRMNLLKIIQGTVSWSYSQAMGRSRKSFSTYNNNQSIGYGSSMNLMEKLKGFLLWRESKNYAKSSSLGYSIRGTSGYDYLTMLRQYTLTPSASLSYKWSATSDLSLSAGWSYTLNNIYEPNPNFKKYVFQNLPDLYNSLAWDRSDVFPHESTSLNLSLSYHFPTSLATNWVIPIIKKTVKLDNQINHTSTITFMNTLYRYKGADRIMEPDDLVARITFQHSITYRFAKNIDGDIWLKLAWDNNLIKDRSIANGGGSGNKYEDVGAFEVGLRLRILF
jgi:hypothetical protein